MATFVLIHGAFRGGWSWRFVRRRLQSEGGHEVFAPSLTGAGERVHLAPEDISLATYISDLVNLFEYEDLRAVVLVGHSHGGFVITAASERLAQRIGHLVYIDAPVPRDGERAVDMLPQAVREADVPLPPREGVIAPRPLEPGAGLSDELVAWSNARLTPHPVRPSYDPVTLRNPQALALPRTYVFCSDTPPVYPCAVTRERLDAEGGRYQLIQSGHDAPLLAPDAVTDLLLGLAAQS